MTLALIAAFAGGCLIGALICYAIMAKTRSRTAFEQQLSELQEEFTAYRENVNSHFNKTAEMVNTLTENYLAVQKHLENAADTFAEAPKSFQLDTNSKLPAPKKRFVSLEARSEQEKSNDADFDPALTQPPLDYAPRASAEDRGTLAEDYGLQQQPEPTRQTGAK